MGRRGHDLFVLGAGDDIIFDFNAGDPEDALVYGGVYASAADALGSATETAGNTVFTYTGGTTTLIGVLISELSETDDFVLAVA